MGKLTKAQRELLTELEDGQTHIATFYQPGLKLVELGLAEWVRESVMAITPAGRAALRKSQGEQG